MKKKEYGLTQKGLNAIDKIIKRSPQYQALIVEFLEDLKSMLNSNCYRTINGIIAKWEKRNES